MKIKRAVLSTAVVVTMVLTGVACTSVPKQPTRARERLSAIVRQDVPQLTSTDSIELQAVAVKACLDAAQYGPLSLGQITNAANNLHGALDTFSADMRTFLDDAMQIYCPTYA